MKRQTAAIGMIALAIIAYATHPLLSGTSPEHEPKPSEEQELLPTLSATITQDVHNPLALVVQTEIINSQPKDKYLNEVTVTNAEGKNVALIVSHKVGPHTFMELCQKNITQPDRPNIPLPPADIMACLAESDPNQILTTTWGQTPITFTLHQPGGQMVIPYAPDNSGMLQIGTTQISREEFRKYMYDLFEFAGTKNDRITNLTTTVALTPDLIQRYLPTATNTPIPIEPTITPTNIPPESDTGVGGTQHPETKVDKTDVNDVSTLTLTIAASPDKQLNIYKLNPNVFNAFFIRIGESLQFNQERFTILKNEVIKEINKQVNWGWILGSRANTGVESTTITNNETFRLVIADTVEDSTDCLISDASGNYYYVTINTQNADMLTYTALDDHGQVIPITTQILNETHARKFIGRNKLFTLPFREETSGFVVHQSYVPSLVAQLSTRTENEQLLDYVAEQGEFVQSYIIMADGSVHEFFIPNGFPYVAQDPNSAEFGWQTLPDGSTIGEINNTYAHVTFDNLYYASDLPDNIPYASRQKVLEQLTALLGPQSNWPRTLHFFVPLGSTIPEKMITTRRTTSDTIQPLTFEINIPAPNVVGVRQLESRPTSIQIAKTIHHQSYRDSVAWFNHQQARRQARQYRQS